MRQFLILILTSLIFLNCTSFGINNLKKHSKNLKHTALTKIQSNPAGQFFLENQGNLIGLISLICIWILYRSYYLEKRKKVVKLNNDDLAMIEMGKDVMNQVWKRIRSNKKVVKLDDFRE
jgi:hypothetical protein